MSNGADLDAAAATRRRCLAWSCTLLMLVVIAASAFLRQHADAADRLVPAELINGVRQLHRVAATLVLLGAIALLLMARRSADRRGLPAATALLAAALLLSVVGVAAGASRATPVVLINLLGGYVMLGLCARLATAGSTPNAQRAQAKIARWLLAALLLQAAAGGWSSSSDPSGDCIVLADCAWPTTLHRGAGLLLGHALLLFGMVAADARRPAGRALVLVALALLLSGMYGSAIGAQAAGGLVVVHNTLAALTLALLIALARA